MRSGLLIAPSQLQQTFAASLDEAGNTVGNGAMQHLPSAHEGDASYLDSSSCFGCVNLTSLHPDGLLKGKLPSCLCRTAGVAKPPNI